MSSSKNVYVQVRNGFSSRRAIVDNDSKALFKFLLVRNFSRNQQEVTQQRLIL